jgi:hypothetical protein
MVFMVLVTGNVFAVPAAEKPNTVILYYDNLNASAPIKRETKEYYLSKLTDKFTPFHNIVDGEPYIQKLKSKGLADLTTTESGNIIPIFQQDNINYIIIIDMMPQTRKYYEWNSDKIISHQYLKVIDVNNNRTLYNIKFAHGSRHESAKGHIEKLYKKTEAALLHVLPK